MQAPQSVASTSSSNAGGPLLFVAPQVAELLNQEIRIYQSLTALDKDTNWSELPWETKSLREILSLIVRATKTPKSKIYRYCVAKDGRVYSERLYPNRTLDKKDVLGSGVIRYIGVTDMLYKVQAHNASIMRYWFKAIVPKQDGSGLEEISFYVCDDRPVTVQEVSPIVLDGDVLMLMLAIAATVKDEEITSYLHQILREWKAENISYARVTALRAIIAHILMHLSVLGLASSKMLAQYPGLQLFPAMDIDAYEYLQRYWESNPRPSSIPDLPKFTYTYIVNKEQQEISLCDSSVSPQFNFVSPAPATLQQVRKVLEWSLAASLRILRREVEFENLLGLIERYLVRDREPRAQYEAILEALVELTTLPRASRLVLSIQAIQTALLGIFDILKLTAEPAQYFEDPVTFTVASEEPYRVYSLMGWRGILARIPQLITILRKQELTEDNHQFIADFEEQQFSLYPEPELVKEAHKRLLIDQYRLALVKVYVQPPQCQGWFQKCWDTSIEAKQARQLPLQQLAHLIQCSYLESDGVPAYLRLLTCVTPKGDVPTSPLSFLKAMRVATFVLRADFKPEGTLCAGLPDELDEGHFEQLLQCYKGCPEEVQIEGIVQAVIRWTLTDSSIGKEGNLPVEKMIKELGKGGIDLDEGAEAQAASVRPEFYARFFEHFGRFFLGQYKQEHNRFASFNAWFYQTPMMAHLVSRFDFLGIHGALQGLSSAFIRDGGNDSLAQAFQVLNEEGVQQAHELFAEYFFKPELERDTSIQQASQALAEASVAVEQAEQALQEIRQHRPEDVVSSDAPIDHSQMAVKQAEQVLQEKRIAHTRAERILFEARYRAWYMAGHDSKDPSIAMTVAMLRFHFEVYFDLVMTLSDSTIQNSRAVLRTDKPKDFTVEGYAFLIIVRASQLFSLLSKFVETHQNREENGRVLQVLSAVLSAYFDDTTFVRIQSSKASEIFGDLIERSIQAMGISTLNHQDLNSFRRLLTSLALARANAIEQRYLALAGYGQAFDATGFRQKLLAQQDLWGASVSTRNQGEMPLLFYSLYCEMLAPNEWGERFWVFFEVIAEDSQRRTLLLERDQKGRSIWQVYLQEKLAQLLGEHNTALSKDQSSPEHKLKRLQDGLRRVMDCILNSNLVTRSNMVKGLDEARNTLIEMALRSVVTLNGLPRKKFQQISQERNVNRFTSMIDLLLGPKRERGEREVDLSGTTILHCAAQLRIPPEAFLQLIQATNIIDFRMTHGEPSDTSFGTRLSSLSLMMWVMMNPEYYTSEIFGELFRKASEASIPLTESVRKDQSQGRASLLHVFNFKNVDQPSDPASTSQGVEPGKEVEQPQDQARLSQPSHLKDWERMLGCNMLHLAFQYPLPVRLVGQLLEKSDPGLVTEALMMRDAQGATPLYYLLYRRELSDVLAILELLRGKLTEQYQHVPLLTENKPALSNDQSIVHQLAAASKDVEEVRSVLHTVQVFVYPLQLRNAQGKTPLHVFYERFTTSIIQLEKSENKVPTALIDIFTLFLQRSDKNSIEQLDSQGQSCFSYENLCAWARYAPSDDQMKQLIEAIATRLVDEKVAIPRIIFSFSQFVQRLNKAFESPNNWGLAKTLLFDLECIPGALETLWGDALQALDRCFEKLYPNRQFPSGVVQLLKECSFKREANAVEEAEPFIQLYLAYDNRAQVVDKLAFEYLERVFQVSFSNLPYKLRRDLRYKQISQEDRQGEHEQEIISAAAMANLMKRLRYAIRHVFFAPGGFSRVPALVFYEMLAGFPLHLMEALKDLIELKANRLRSTQHWIPFLEELNNLVWLPDSKVTSDCIHPYLDQLLELLGYRLAWSGTEAQCNLARRLERNPDIEESVEPNFNQGLFDKITRFIQGFLAYWPGITMTANAGHTENRIFCVGQPEEIEQRIDECFTALCKFVAELPDELIMGYEIFDLVIPPVLKKETLLTWLRDGLLVIKSSMRDFLQAVQPVGVFNGRPFYLFSDKLLFGSPKSGASSISTASISVVGVTKGLEPAQQDGSASASNATGMVTSIAGTTTALTLIGRENLSLILVAELNERLSKYVQSSVGEGSRPYFVALAEEMACEMYCSIRLVDASQDSETYYEVRYSAMDASTVVEQPITMREDPELPSLKTQDGKVFEVLSMSAMHEADDVSLDEGIEADTPKPEELSNSMLMETPSSAVSSSAGVFASASAPTMNLFAAVASALGSDERTVRWNYCFCASSDYYKVWYENRVRYYHLPLDRFDQSKYETVLADLRIDVIALAYFNTKEIRVIDTTRKTEYCCMPSKEETTDCTGRTIAHTEGVMTLITEDQGQSFRVLAPGQTYQVAAAPAPTA